MAELSIVVAIMAASGACAGLLGIGGALVFNPFLLQLGVHPQVTFWHVWRILEPAGADQCCVRLLAARGAGVALLQACTCSVGLGTRL